MNFSDLLHLQKKQLQFNKKKTFLLQKALRERKLQQINSNQQSTKKGYIEKTKLIKKKQFQKVYQKPQTQKPQIQDNSSVSSYLINNSNFNKIYERTKKIISFVDFQKLQQSVNALKAFSEEHFETILHLKLTFDKEINCGKVIRPFQLRLTEKLEVDFQKKLPIPKAIILIKSAKKLSKNPSYSRLVSFPIAIKQFGQFLKQWRRYKSFKKKVVSNRILILCEWDIFKKSPKILENLLSKGFIVFPFDIKNVPYSVKQQFQGISYEHYLKLMLQSQYTLIKSGIQHSIHLKFSKETSSLLLTQNIKESIIQTVSKLIERNKDKSGNHLTKVQAKTDTSINFVIYERKS